ncbi:MAG: ATP-grasp domain-containing protein [Clostridia bacterium]|nr:ATP-grasp domain-containing protein [Clostridia bacterium]
MKRLLIIGASVLQLPAIKRAKEMGLYVAVLDYDPRAVGIPYADEYFNESTIDPEGVCRAAREFRPDGIMTLATDMPMRSLAAACRELGLRGISCETAVRSTDKGEMIRAFREAGVAHPWYHVVEDGAALPEEGELSFPCIIKPTDNAGSRGVALVHSYEELPSRYEYARASSRRGAVIIEEYLTGREVSVEIVVTGGVVHILAITDKLTTGAPHFVEMGHTQPSSLPSDILAEVSDLATRAVTAVGIDDCPAHVEIMVTDEGPKMIELGARMGGDCITSHLVPLSTGVDMIEATVRISLGDRVDLTPKHSRGSAIRYFDVPEGVIEGVEGADAARALPGVREITLVKGVGDRVGAIGSSSDRVGFVIADGESAEDAVRACDRALETVKFKIRKD